MTNLILDDVRDEQACFQVTGNQRYLQLDWDIVKTYDEFVNYIQTHPMPNIISWDHDLGPQAYKEGAFWRFEYFDYKNISEKTGYHALLWLIEYCVDNNIKLPESYVHSMNPYGKSIMESTINKYWKVYYG